MNEQSYSLLPFPTDTPFVDIQISSSIARNANAFVASYVLQGSLSEIVIPDPVERPIRKNNLWEETCFEFFLGKKGSGQYWEFNLSPSGHWNVYRFSSYRQGMQEETALIPFPMSVQQEPDALRLALEIDLVNIVRAGQALEVGISAVVKMVDGRMSCWALAHPDTRPDFHQRDSFIVKL